jgi:hypothetical protein
LKHSAVEQERPITIHWVFLARLPRRDGEAPTTTHRIGTGERDDAGTRSCVRENVVLDPGKEIA